MGQGKKSTSTLIDQSGMRADTRRIEAEANARVGPCGQTDRTARATYVGDSLTTGTDGKIRGADQKDKFRINIGCRPSGREPRAVARRLAIGGPGSEDASNVARHEMMLTRTSRGPEPRFRVWQLALCGRAARLCRLR